MLIPFLYFVNVPRFREMKVTYTGVSVNNASYLYSLGTLHTLRDGHSLAISSNRKTSPLLHMS